MSDFITVSSPYADKQLLLLVDTEAHISIIKKSSLNSLCQIDSNEIISMKGICDGRQLSLGSSLIPLIFEHLQIEHKIHVVDDKFPIPAHGIIGKDFIKRNKCLIDYDKMTLTLRPSNVLPATIPIRAEVLRGLSVLPARSETFKMFRVSSTKYPCIIESQEIAENVFIPTTVIHAQECWIHGVLILSWTI